MTFIDFIWHFTDPWLSCDAEVALALAAPRVDELFLVTIDTRTGEVAK